MSTGAELKHLVTERGVDLCKLPCARASHDGVSAVARAALGGGGGAAVHCLEAVNNPRRLVHGLPLFFVEVVSATSRVRNILLE